MIRPAPQPRRIVFGVTSHISAYAFLTGQLAHLSSSGWDVHLIVGSEDPGLSEFARSQDVTLHVLPVSRDPGPTDLWFIARLARLLRSIRPSVSVMATPKMGVFGTVAAAFARVPVRIYHVLGLRWDGLSGQMRRVIRGLDRLACWMATDVVAVSTSLGRRILDEGVAPSSKVLFVGHGSIGVDVQRFEPIEDAERRRLRDHFGIPPSARVVTFVARLTRDKGIDHLPAVWAGVVDRASDAWLLVVGDPEPGESVDELKRLPHTSLRSHTSEVEKVYQVADLNLSLSRREGLGLVPLEAAACGVPTAAFAVTGIIDTVEDGVSGRLVAAGDVAGLIDAVSQSLTSPGELERLGRRARDSVVQRHRAEDVREAWRVLLEARSHR